MKTIRFLIVEDHEFQRLMLERALRAIGAETIHAVSSGALAIRLLRDPAFAVDIIITDLMMPDIDGIELVGLLVSSATRVPVVLVSADAHSLNAAVDIAQGSGIEVVGAIAKPITPDNLWAVLGPYLAGREPAERP